MKTTTLFVALLCGALTTGCVQNYASREVAQGAAPATLVVTNAPQGARILVNGREVGVVGQAAGIPVATGRHDVTIESGGHRLHSQAVFVSAGSRVEVRVP
ncbi:PEGA domain-containing protein [Brevundimonas sp.]|uniref:PEGA domain-containing protein n=1 Tax=Brevundimonas sp. TaxID=1871086 RepID=UPI00351D0572